MIEENIIQEFILKKKMTHDIIFLKILRKMIWYVKSTKRLVFLNYIKHFLILGSTITRCISISAFASFNDIPIGIMSSAIGLKICAITAGIKNYHSRIMKRKMERDKAMSFEKPKSNSRELSVSKPLIGSVISNDEFVLINNVLKEYNEMKKKNKNWKT